MSKEQEYEEQPARFPEDLSKMLFTENFVI